MKHLNYLFVLFLVFSFAACSDDDNDYVLVPPKVAIENLSGQNSVMEGDTIYLKANVESNLQSKFVWTVGNTQKSANITVTDSIFKFVQDVPGNYTVQLVCINPDGESSASIDLSVFGQFKNGTFILNEGSAFQENSSLSFITPNGTIIDSVYMKANGTELGNVTQDLFIANGKIYFVAQNGKSSYGNYPNDGKLIIANAETLKKEAAFDSELESLSWPTHISVIGNEAFIRDNNGVYLFNTSTKELKFVVGSKGALKNRMAVVKNKVFVPANKSVFVLQPGKTQVADTIKFDAAVSAVIKTSDNNLYVSTTGTPNKIFKINPSDYSIIKENEITEGKVSAGWGASPGISAKGDTIYYGGASTKIYRHIFSSGKSEFLIDGATYVEDASMAYNNLAVNPLTGEVFQTTIKGYGQNFLINNISVFNFATNTPRLSINYKNHTHFPAGIFFTYDFE